MNDSVARGHHKGFNFLAHLLLGLGHNPPSRVTNGRQSEFAAGHPEYVMGEPPAGVVEWGKRR